MRIPPLRRKQTRPASKRKKPPTVDFSIRTAMANAIERMSQEPPAGVVRGEPVGSLLWRFVLPLAQCVGQNFFANVPVGVRKKLRQQALDMMLAQHRFQRRQSPLPGRPLIRAIRFSSVQPDYDNGWTKIPIDRLTGKHDGLNFLVDDRPKCMLLRHWWEPARAGHGYCYFEVWTG